MPSTQTTHRPDAPIAPDADEKRQGRDRVRALLWDRLAEAGLTRRKGEAADAFAAWQSRLTDRLAYMTPDNLMTLAEVLIPLGQGPARLVMPPEAVIRGFAHALQSPPAEQARIVTSWLASVEGPPALAEGYAVELFAHLARTGTPPMAYDMRAIRDRAADNLRRVALIEDRLARDAADAEDRAWLAHYRRTLARVQQIVADGAARRAAPNLTPTESHAQ